MWKGSSSFWALADSKLTAAENSYKDTEIETESKLCSADGSTHTESNKLYRKVKHRACPNLSSRQRPKRAPIRQRSRRWQRRGESHIEHGLGEACRIVSGCDILERSVGRVVFLLGVGGFGVHGGRVEVRGKRNKNTRHRNKALTLAHAQTVLYTSN